MNKIELLAPAGDLEKLKIAIDYGADAVYFGGEIFGLRAGARNFNIQEMKEGVSYAHNAGKKVYLTINIFANNEDIDLLEGFLKSVAALDLDGFIISDPGILSILKDIIPKAEIHLSTQANTTNFRSAAFWHEIGVKRIVLARELSFKEIQEIRSKVPAGLELEAFVHGAMCISYSGRCLLSNFMADRDANRGECAHPCRWKYNLVEEKRPGEYYPVVEDERGTYVFNSKDLCMIQHIPELIQAGLGSLKIEGRMKSIFYVATIAMQDQTPMLLMKACLKK
jgi:putative protease